MSGLSSRSWYQDYSDHYSLAPQGLSFSFDVHHTHLSHDHSFQFIHLRCRDPAERFRTTRMMLHSFVCQYPSYDLVEHRQMYIYQCYDGDVGHSIHTHDHRKRPPLPGQIPSSAGNATMRRYRDGRKLSVRNTPDQNANWVVLHARGTDKHQSRTCCDTEIRFARTKDDGKYLCLSGVSRTE
jgi:hypothetical protein